MVRGRVRPGRLLPTTLENDLLFAGPDVAKVLIGKAVTDYIL